jgi:hypothetical protein
MVVSVEQRSFSVGAGVNSGVASAEGERLERCTESDAAVRAGASMYWGERAGSGRIEKGRKRRYPVLDVLCIRRKGE